MIGDVVQLRDYDARRPVYALTPGAEAEVVILPVVRVERREFVPKPPRAPRRSLLGEPA